MFLKISKNWGSQRQERRQFINRKKFVLFQCSLYSMTTLPQQYQMLQFDSVLDNCTNSLMTELRNYTEDQLQLLLNEEDRLNKMIDNLQKVTGFLSIIA